MIYTHPMQHYHRLAVSAGRRIVPNLAGAARAAFLALLMAVAPALTSLTAGAQEVAPPARSASVNINAADAETLADGLSGVGLARAQEIIRHREAYGPFVSVDELAEVKGIGQATIEKNRPVITLE